jgi:V/A-type H+-transporting ATPase subunit A
MSEPVTQNSLKNSQVFLALDADLAAKRHYPAINWNTSYSLYEETFNQIMNKQGEEGQQLVKDRKQAKSLLAREGELSELVKIVGMDGLDNHDRLVLEIGRSLREDYLQQDAFDDADTYCEFDKAKIMLRTIIRTYELIDGAIERNSDNENFVAEAFTADLKQKLANMKYQENADAVQQTYQEIENNLSQL